MRKTTMTIAAGCTTLTVGLLLLFNNSPGRENTVSPPISGISSEADTSENVSPSMDEEPSVTMVNEDVSVTSDTKPLKDQSTDEESLTSMALEVYFDNQ